MISSGCASSELPSPTAAVPTISPTRTDASVQSTQTPAGTPRQTPSASIATDIPSLITAAATKHCALEQIRDFAQFGLEAGEYLLLQKIGASTNEVWFLSGKDSVPQMLPIQVRLGDITHIIGTSADGRSLALMARDSTDSADRLWFLSLPQGSGRSVPIRGNWLLGYWAEDSGIILLDYQSGNTTPVPVDFIDRNTLQTTPLQLPPEEALSFGATRQKGIFLLGSQWFVLDFETGENTPTFPWLDQLDLYNDPFTVFTSFRVSAEQDEPRYSVIVKRPYGMDFALHMDSSHAGKTSDYQSAMTQVMFPEQYRDFQLGYWSPERDSLTFDFAASAQSTSTTLALAKFGQQDVAIWDLCVDRAASGPVLPDSQMKLLAWTKNKSSDSSDPFSSVVIQIETGKVLELPGFRVIGWGTATSP